MRKTLWVLLALTSVAVAQSGSSLFQQHCASCHLETGKGRPGAFPPLVGSTTDFAQTPEGRSHLIRVLLYGMQGKITVQTKPYNGIMPAFGRVSDTQLAIILNHILKSWDNFKLLPKDFKDITAEEISAARQNKLTSVQVGTARPDTKTTPLPTK